MPSDHLSPELPALSGLKDIHLPPPVSFWPPAPGWWISAIFLILLLLACGWKLWGRHIRSRAKREALCLLKNLRAQYQKSPETLPTLRELSRLLRRTALAYFDRERVASLHGAEWLEFLDKTGKNNRSGNSDEFTQGAGRILGTEIYQEKIKTAPEDPPQMEVLFPLVEKWIKGCRPEK